MNKGKATIEHPMAANRKTTTSRAPIDLQSSALAGAQEKMQQLQQQEEEVSPEKHFDEQELSNLKDLIFLGYAQDEIIFGGYKFFLSTLTSLEKREIAIALASVGNLREANAYIKTCLLAKSVRTVNGAPLDVLYSGDENLSDFQKRVAVIENMQSGLSEALYEKYEEIASRGNLLFKPTDTSEPTLGEKVKK